MALTLDTGLRIGIQTLHRRTEPATAPWQPRIDALVELVQLVDRCGYDSLWTGDHVAFAVPILDPLLQLAQAAVVSRRLTLGTAAYLLPLRHPAPVAKQVATLDHLTEGRLIFGIGVGGEFPKEFELCGVPHNERGPRLGEAVGVLLIAGRGSPGVALAQLGVAGWAREQAGALSGGLRRSSGSRPGVGDASSWPAG